MGLDPENGEYEVGINNPSCHATLFLGETPKYVEIRFNGIIKCQPFFPDPPNRVFLLTQLAGGDTWRVTDAPYGASWELKPGFSRAGVSEGINLWFLSQVGPQCRTFFNNQNVCGGAFIGENGTAEIFWGPSIHP